MDTTSTHNKRFFEGLKSTPLTNKEKPTRSKPTIICDVCNKPCIKYKNNKRHPYCSDQARMATLRDYNKKR